MAGDFRRNGAPRPTFRRHQPRSCVWWFLLGAMFGSFGVGLYWMMEAPHQVPTTVAAIPGTERPAPPQPSFEFPNILRDTEVEIGRGKPLPPPAPRPEPILPEEPVADAPQTETEPTAPSGTYVLQVGSFKSAKDAEGLKAQLAMLGVSTRVQRVTIRNGEVWHRVMTGPLASKKAMEETRNTLKRHGRDAMPVKVK